MQESSALRRRPRGAVEKRLEAIPLGRVASAIEVAEAICFLLSDGASYMTGQAINVSGGMVTW